MSKHPKAPTLGSWLASMVLAEIAKSGRCVIPGFGIFTIGTRAARVIVNPATKELMALPEDVELRFFVGKQLKQVVRKSRVVAGNGAPCDVRHEEESEHG